MAVEVIMPKAGIDMTEGQINKWFKKEGDKVEAGELLLEIMTDKTSMELEAEESGYLIKILKGEGETVPVTEVIGYIGAELQQQHLQHRKQKLHQLQQLKLKHLQLKLLKVKTNLIL